MRTRLRNSDGFMLVELLVASVVLSMALLALMAVYDSSFMSLHKAAQKTAAATLAQNQLELYSALSYTDVGLDPTSLTTAKANSTYSADENSLSPSGGTDVSLSSACSETQCLPIQTLTGNDRRSYTVETFVRDIDDLGYSGRPERVVNVIVRDPSTTGTPIVAEQSSAYDQGPATTTVVVTTTS
jgi:type II secretory pathway pseudopilin PulG